MSKSGELGTTLISNYDHRSPEDLDSELDPKQILESYANQKGIKYTQESYDNLNAIIGRLNGSEGEVISATHYTTLEEDNFAAKTEKMIYEMDNIGAFMDQYLPDSRIISGIDITNSPRFQSPLGNEIAPESAFCVLFYDYPDFEPMEMRARAEKEWHKVDAMNSVKDPALATALILSSKEEHRTPSGRVSSPVSAAQIDYWPETIDQQIGDFRELDWDDPANI